MAREFKSLRRDLAVNVQGELVYRNLAAHPLLNPDLVAGRDLRDDLLDRLVMTVFLEGREPLRSSAAFDARLAAHRGGLGAAGPGDRARRAGRAGTAVPDPGGAAESGRARRPRTSVRSSPGSCPPASCWSRRWERLQEFPRYLQAIEQRLEKARPATRGATRSSPRKSRRWSRATVNA